MVFTNNRNVRKLETRISEWFSVENAPLEPPLVTSLILKNIYRKTRLDMEESNGKISWSCAIYFILKVSLNTRK